MAVSVELARDAASRSRAWAFRYRIYVEEMGFDTPEADHGRRELRDELDDSSESWSLLEDDELLGTLRVTRLDALPDAGWLLERFALEPALRDFSAKEICFTSRFMLHPRVRRGTAILRLMRAVYADGRQSGLRLNYGDCSPHLLPFYEQLGYRRYRRAFNDSIYGFKVPILMVAGDRVHLERVRSPLARSARDHADDAAARAWFGRCYPRYVDVESAELLPEGEFLELLTTRLANDPLHSLGLLKGLTAEQASCFLARATLVRASPGDRIVREGESGDTTFVMLSGVAEVVRQESGGQPLRVLGPGDPFGELALLTRGHRTASVVARTACEAVVLSGEFLRDFIGREPLIASRVLLNLAHVLALRLCDLTPRAAGAT